jgi:hypothetical protein
VFKQLPQTSRKHLLLFDHDGGRGSHGRDCGATTPHGFLGIEKKVVSAMTEWMLNAVKIKK